MNISSIFEIDQETKRIHKDISKLYGFERSLDKREITIFPEEHTRQDREIPIVAPLWAVWAEGKWYKLSLPIQVHISKEGDLYFAENEALLLYGMGESIREAVEDLGQDIFYFWEYYRNLSWDDVIGDGRRLKEIYERLLIEQQ